MRIVITILLLAILSTPAFSGDDWRIQSFDKDMALTEERWTREAELMKKIEPETALFYERWSDFLRTVRDMRMYAFQKRLKEDPAAQWLDADPMHWVVWSAEEWKRLAAADSSYRKMLEEYYRKRNDLNEAGVRESKKLRDKTFLKRAELFKPLVDDTAQKSKQLKKDITNALADRVHMNSVPLPSNR